MMNETVSSTHKANQYAQKRLKGWLRKRTAMPAGFTVRTVTYHLLLVALLPLLIACEEPKSTKQVKAYEGPIEEINDVTMLYSEGAMLRVRMTTAKQFRYQNDDRKYPQTVNILFYGPNGEEVTTLRSDSGRYNKTKDLYTVMGNVVVINKQKQEKLTTDELNWNPQTKKVYTERPVYVESKATGERLKAEGLDSNQDFTQYSLRGRVTGVFNVEGSGF